MSLHTSRLTFDELHANPHLAAAEFRLRSGETGLIRPLAASDGQRLGGYFTSLSAETRRRFGPHGLDQQTADDLCADIDVSQVLRMVAVLRGPSAEDVIAYFILMFGVTRWERERYAGQGITLEDARDCTLAPSVADAYQNVGLGGIVFSHVAAIARRLGRARMVLLGGTQVTNARAVHFYVKQGFRTIGAFEYPDGVGNYDMLLEL